MDRCGFFVPPPLTLKKLIDDTLDYEIVVASRYVEGGRDDRAEKIRVITSRLFNQIAKVILHSNINDLTSGYIIAKRTIFDKIRIRVVYGEYCIRFLYESEKENIRIKEIPYICLSGSKDKSKTSSNIFMFMFYSLIYMLTVFKLRLSINDQPH